MTAPDSGPLPRVGNRVALRRLRAADLAQFQGYRHDAEVGRYQGWAPLPEREALAFLREMSSVGLFPAQRWFQLGIADRATDVLIGDFGICVAPVGATAEIGFTVARHAQGRGLATEAAALAIGLLFDCTPITRVIAITDARNHACIRLLQRLGMQHVETSSAVFRGAPCTEHGYAIARSSQP